MTVFNAWRNRIVTGGVRPIGGPDLSERGDPMEVHRFHLHIVAEAERAARSYRQPPLTHDEQLAKVASLDAAWEAKRVDRRGGGRDRRRDVRRHGS